MQKVLSALSLLLLSGCATMENTATVRPDKASATETQNQSPQAEYDWNEVPDYLQLRNDFGAKDNFYTLCEANRPLRDMVDAMNAERWQQAVELGRRHLNRCPVDVRTHYYTAIAFSELGQTPESELHARWMRGLMDSIVASGDGESCETAYVTISIAEEYDALSMFGLEPESQAIVDGPHTCDLMKTKTEDGTEVNVYFYPDAHFRRLEKMFDES